MKQKGKIWYDSSGQQVPAKYLGPYDKVTEATASLALSIAAGLEKDLQIAKIDIVQACKKAYAEYLKLNKAVQFFGFTSFDKSVKVEYDTKNHYIRVYRATKENPSHKDYELIRLSISEVELELDEKAVPPSRNEDLPGATLGEGESG